jgi:gamma-glutamyl hercynylcysteine S-oxide hydrolase
MCRHFAYLGPEVPLKDLIIDPPHGLYRQSWTPRRQEHGTINADGFGVGWYPAPHPPPWPTRTDPPHADPVPARYRRTVPIWADPSFADVARVTRSGAVLAAVRDATPGTAHDEAAVAPFASDRWLFSHNGVLDGWPDSAAVRQLAGTLPPESLLSLEAHVDTALLWALVLRRLRGGVPMEGALSSVLAELEAAGAKGRFNFLLTDGDTICASAWGDSLWYRKGTGEIRVASEPCDDDPGWESVPDQHILTADLERITIA